MSEGLKDHTRSGLLLGLLMFLSFALVTINSYAIAKGNFFWLGVTDGMLTFLNWTILKRVNEAEHWHERAGYIVGGIAGGQVALWIAIHWLITRGC